MNARSGILALGSLLFGIYAVTSILLGDSNSISHLTLYMLAGSGLLAMANPRKAIILLLATCAYIDLIKRLMVVSGRVTMTDLFYVLGVPPVLLGMILASALIRISIGQIVLTQLHWRLLWIAIGMMLATTGMTYLAGERSISALVQTIANGGFYATVIFVVPLFFPTIRETLELLQKTLWIFVPVGIYGVFQKIAGFQNFEVEYLLTGLSIEVKQLMSDRVRAFSTLNSPTALGTIGGVFAILPLVLSQIRNQKGQAFMSQRVAIFMALVFGAATLASTSRTALILPVFIAIGTIAFQTRRGTLLLYTISIVSFVSLLISAKFLLVRLEQISDTLVQLAGSTLDAEFVSVNTFSDRLQGFTSVLLNPKAYTLFGHGANAVTSSTDELYNHDLMSNILVRFGAVPLLSMIVLMVSFVRWIHKQILSVDSWYQRRWCAAMISTVLALIAISMVSGNVLTVFPVNVIFWLSVSAVIVAVRQPSPLASSGVNQVNQAQPAIQLTTLKSPSADPLKHV